MFLNTLLGARPARVQHRCPRVARDDGDAMVASCDGKGRGGCGEAALWLVFVVVMAVETWLVVVIMAAGPK